MLVLSKFRLDLVDWDIACSITGAVPEGHCHSVKYLPLI